MCQSIATPQPKPLINYERTLPINSRTNLMRLSTRSRSSRSPLSRVLCDPGSALTRVHELQGGTLTGSITEVDVERLFGRYNYKIHLANGRGAETPRISLLYGDNGTGKTTILELIFHLLSSADRRGHRTYVARAPFKRISISFSDHSRLTATKTSEDLVGDFELELDRGCGRTEFAKIEVDPEGAVLSGSSSTEADRLFEKISALDLHVYYLGDSRDFEGDQIPGRDRRGLLRPGVPSPFLDPEWARLGIEDFGAHESTLRESIRRAERWLNREAIRASTTGETDARQSNAGILRTIASTNAPTGSALVEEVRRLQRELEELEGMSSDFAEFGLGAIIEADSLSESLKSANTMTLPIVVQVLGSFLDGQRARLNALRATYEKMRGFVDITNEYLTDKNITLDVYRGITVQIPGSELDPDVLSSGEKHLLLLFLNVFVSSDQSPLFIIDEPELSLNVKWQRRLVESLLELSQNSQCQFLMATHSIELLTQHRQYVVQLIHDG